MDVPITFLNCSAGQAEKAHKSTTAKRRTNRRRIMDLSDQAVDNIQKAEDSLHSKAMHHLPKNGRWVYISQDFEGE